MDIGPNGLIGIGKNICLFRYSTYNSNNVPVKRDTPGGNGDHELFKLIKMQESTLCEKPRLIAARVASTKDRNSKTPSIDSIISNYRSNQENILNFKKANYKMSGNYVQISTQFGLQCWNKFQPKKECEDFEVKFCCPHTTAQCDGK